MEAMEVLAILILIIAIAVLVYYYLMSNPSTMRKVKSYTSSGAGQASKTLNETSLSLKKDVSEKGGSMGNKIKVKLSDIDTSILNTDAFSKKLDTFLDSKSEELIQNWSLATKKDVVDLESKFSEATANVDDLEKEFNEFKKSSEEFQKSTEDKLSELDKRIESLEEN